MSVDTSIPRQELGAATLNRKWFIDVDTAAPAGPASWIGIFGVQELKPTADYTSQDTSDMSSGYKSDTVTALGWGYELKLIRKTQRSTPASYDPGQEFLRSAAATMGGDNSVHIRVYEMNGATGPKVEAYAGYCSVTWEPDGGGMDAVETVTVKLTGQGAKTSITHPTQG